MVEDNMVRRIIRRFLGRKRGANEQHPNPSAATQPVKPPLPPAPSVPEPEVEVEGEEVAKWVSEGRPVHFLDIREVHEMTHGHVAGATLLPMNQVPHQHAQLPKGVPLVVYCAAGARSFGVAHHLREHGFEDAWSLVGGIGAWIDQDREAWVSPPYGAKIRLTMTMKLKPEASKRLGREEGEVGSVQFLGKEEDQITITLGILSEGGLERVEGLYEDDVEPVGRTPR